MAMELGGKAWRRPATLLGLGGLLLSLTGGLVTLHQEHERQQETRLQRLEQGEAVRDQALADGYQAILIRLDGLREALAGLRSETHRENDALLRRLETLERRGR